ncbi:hypothetical protein PCASD_07754 [Puccinia coronata f. sp. avenae]|uniref:Myb/SANT-like domain-containing protein n=1 Tax=Puccinia coronata f. sp. avenae TaxID=200324 RepID=A0A2N5UXB5_9BASI|nr:hypothetical protein PCASD_07754 [Puccinia coronata f. sp. avenae]
MNNSEERQNVPNNPQGIVRLLFEHSSYQTLVKTPNQAILKMLSLKNTSHRHVAQQLREAFPETKFLLDYNTCKSKLNQSFKQDYKFFLALKEASGFGWDEISCEVHPNAQKFWGVPYPEFWNLDKIFGTSLATGEASRLLSQQLLGNSQSANPNASGGSGPNGESIPNNATNSPTAYLSRSHSNSKRETTASAITSLVLYLQSLRKDFNNQLEARLSSLAAPPPVPPIPSITCQALQLYQEVHAPEGSQNKALEAIELFRDNMNANIFVGIKDTELQGQWLRRQIDQMNEN